MTSRCSICTSEHIREHDVRELRFGTGDPFTYGECARCGALELLNPPADSSRYYPDEYYAFAPKVRPRWANAIRRARNRLLLGGRGPLSRAVERVKTHAARQWLTHAGIGRDARILDVGCGAGDLLRDLADAGFTSLLGVDPLIPEPFVDAAGFRVVKGSLADIEGVFDLVMFHHSLEHIPAQRDTLTAAARLLAPGGVCLIRLPVVPNAAWEEYREYWVQLDPPRHVVIHTETSLARVAADAGMSLAAVEYDSTALQFVGSELYRRGLRLDEAGRVFSRREMRRFDARARALNAQRRGDQASFYFRRTAVPPATPIR